jgi:hypothetical protein
MEGRARCERHSGDAAAARPLPPWQQHFLAQDLSWAAGSEERVLFATRVRGDPHEAVLDYLHAIRRPARRHNRFPWAVAPNDHLNGEVIRLDGAL